MDSHEPHRDGRGRRRVLAALLLAGAGVAAGRSTHAQVPVAAARGTQAPEPPPERAREAIEALLRGRTPGSGRVSLDIPRLAENGLAVPLEARVQSPMTRADHVRVLHIIAPANPIPTVARFHFTPASGEAALRTRIRLADSQTVLAFAELSDDSVWQASAPVVVTLGGCLDPVL